MNASKVMRLEVTTIPPELPVERAHRLMLDLGVRHLPVLSGHRLAGIVSDRDVLLGCTRDKTGGLVYPSQSVGAVMSLAPEVAGPNVPIAVLAKTMVEAKIDALPIVSKDNELLGLVTSTDLLLLLTELPSEEQPTISYQLRRVDTLAALA
jgi:acetoin utilization protein AcuB